jgi:hypothetical protein
VQDDEPVTDPRFVLQMTLVAMVTDAAWTLVPTRVIKMTEKIVLFINPPV